MDYPWYIIFVMFCWIKFGLNKCNYNCYIQVSMDKWINITDMEYVIASRYNVILVSLSPQQNMMFFPLRSQPPGDPSVHRIICIGHVYDNHFVQVHCRYNFFFIFMQSVVYDWVNTYLFLHVRQIYLKNRCPLPSIALLWSTNCHTQAKQ